jgi:hypothetical protein
MNESYLTEKELRNIKTICEYLFFDQFKDSASYQGFERAFSSLLPKKEIQLDIVFKEICGEKKKYINYQRFIKTYIKYKKNENLKEDTKIFFNEIFNNILKSPGDFIGNDMEKSLKFTTATYKNYSLDIYKEYIFGKKAFWRNTSFSYLAGYLVDFPGETVWYYGSKYKMTLEDWCEVQITPSLRGKIEQSLDRVKEMILEVRPDLKYFCKKYKGEELSNIGFIVNFYL